MCYSHSTYNLHACSAVITSPSVRKVSCSGCHHVISPLINCPFCTSIDAGHQATWYKRKCRTNWLINHVFVPLSSILSQICDSDSHIFCTACLILRKVAVGLGFQRDQVLRTVRLCATDIGSVCFIHDFRRVSSSRQQKTASGRGSCISRAPRAAHLSSGSAHSGAM